jgi:hypothetical protein
MSVRRVPNKQTAMNIFFISTDAAEAARMHGDKHVIKMILESTQMLITCHRVLEDDDSWILKFKSDLGGKEPYKMTHKNHPCAIWARTSLANYAWLCDLALALCDEKMARWPDKKPHACRPMLEWLAANPPPTLTRSEMTEPATAMPDEFKVPGDPVASYRRYYRHKFEIGIAAYGRMPDRVPRFIIC